VQKYKNKNARAFTVHGTGFLTELVSAIWISEFITPDELDDERYQEIRRRHEYKCVWDTGAMDSSISPRVAKELGLIPTGRTQFQGVRGAGEEEVVYDANTYLVNVYFPHGVLIHGVTISDVESPGCDVLLGMDIIRFGDLAISNFDGKTTFSFRSPPIAKIDFVQEINSMREEKLKSSVSDEQRRKAKNKRKQSRKDRKK